MIAPTAGMGRLQLLIAVVLVTGCGPQDLAALGNFTPTLVQMDPYISVVTLQLDYDFEEQGCVTLGGELQAFADGVEVEVKPGGMRRWFTTSAEMRYTCDLPSVTVPHPPNLASPLLLELNVDGVPIVVEATGYGQVLDADPVLPEGGVHLGDAVTIALGAGWTHVPSFYGIDARNDGVIRTHWTEVLELTSEGLLTLQLPDELTAGRVFLSSTILDTAPAIIRCEGAEQCATEGEAQTSLSVELDVAP